MSPRLPPGGSFVTLSLAKDVTTGESHYVIKEFRVDEGTKEFLSDFYANEAAWKNAPQSGDTRFSQAMRHPAAS